MILGGSTIAALFGHGIMTLCVGDFETDNKLNLTDVTTYSLGYKNIIYTLLL